MTNTDPPQMLPPIKIVGAPAALLNHPLQTQGLIIVQPRSFEEEKNLGVLKQTSTEDCDSLESSRVKELVGSLLTSESNHDEEEINSEKSFENNQI